MSRLKSNSNIKKITLNFEINKQLYDSLDFYLDSKGKDIEKEIKENTEDIIDKLISKNIPKEVQKFLIGMGYITKKEEEKENINSLNSYDKEELSNINVNS